MMGTMNERTISAPLSNDITEFTSVLVDSSAARVTHLSNGQRVQAVENPAEADVLQMLVRGGLLPAVAAPELLRTA